MKVLMVSLSVNGSLGDYFKILVKKMSQKNETAVLTNYKISADIVGAKDICCLHFDKQHPLDFLNPYNYWKAWRFLKAITYDVCFIYTPHPANLFLYNWINRDKTCVYVHDHYHHSGITFANYIVQKCNHYLFYKKTARVIVACDYIKNDILKRNLMVDASKIEVCELGLLENLCFPATEGVEDIDVLFFGRIKYYKGLDILVKTASLIPQTNIVIAGRGNLKKECKIDQLPSNCKHLNRYVADEELAKLIQRSKVVVLPYRDATGTQTIQSIYYYKKPIIATRVGCFPEYIIDGHGGIIVEPEEEIQLAKAINILLNSDILRKQYGEYGYNTLLHKFSNDRIINRLEEILASLI